MLHPIPAGAHAATSLLWALLATIASGLEDEVRQEARPLLRHVATARAAAAADAAEAAEGAALGAVLGDGDAGSGCCFSIGFGDRMKPCCLTVETNMSDGACRASATLRLGGATGFSAQGCPSSPEEARELLEHESSGVRSGCCFSIGYGDRMEPCCLEAQRG